jgi:hypothetical protein
MASRISPETEAKIAEAWPDILEALARGDRIDLACLAAGVNPGCVRVYRVAHPARNKEWELAREESAHAFADKGLREMEREHRDQTDVASARARADYYRWLASKRLPSTYSDKAQLDVNVKHVDLTRTIEAANARLAAAAANVRILERSPLAYITGGKGNSRAHDVQDAELVPERSLADLQ